MRLRHSREQARILQVSANFAILPFCTCKLLSGGRRIAAGRLAEVEKLLAQEDRRYNRVLELGREAVGADRFNRVDLPGADPKAMYESLETLKALPDSTNLFPGHLYSPEGHDSMASQKRTNPYLRAQNVEMFLSFMGH